MTRSQQLKLAVQRSLYRLGYKIERVTAEEREAFFQFDARSEGPPAEAVFGSLDRLAELRTRYAEVRLPVAVHSVWGARDSAGQIADIGLSGVDLRRFRGHSSYVWDYGGAKLEAARLKYYLFAEAVRAKDEAGLLQRLKEDGAFGCATFSYDGIGRVSRDLLDSVAEINFLQRHLKVLDRDDLGVLDVGAGYGRMAHRMLEANPALPVYTCVDAIPESTFLCEFYLRHRGLDSRAEVIPLDEVDAALTAGQHGLALNIHSFSECTYAAVEWWLRRIREMGVQHLMIVPNDEDRFLSTETDHSRRDYAPLVASLGYREVAREPVFSDENVRSLLGVRDSMFLFELRA